MGLYKRIRAIIVGDWITLRFPCIKNKQKGGGGGVEEVGRGRSPGDERRGEEGKGRTVHHFSSSGLGKG